MARPCRHGSSKSPLRRDISTPQEQISGALPVCVSAAAVASARRRTLALASPSSLLLLVDALRVLHVVLPMARIHFFLCVVRTTRRQDQTANRSLERTGRRWYSRAHRAAAVATRWPALRRTTPTDGTHSHTHTHIGMRHFLVRACAMLANKHAE